MYVFSRCWSISGVHRTWRCLLTRLALGELDRMAGERSSLSALDMSSSTKGSVATLSGLVQPLGAEKPELPPEETEESEKEEQTEFERCSGCLESRLSLMRSHSWLGLSSWLEE